MQTPREVIQRLFQTHRPERIGLRDSPWHDTLLKWTGQGYPTDEKGKPVNPNDHFAFDMVGIGSFPWKARLENDEIVEETDEWKIVRDGNGASFKWWKHKSGTPEHVDFAMTSRRVWETDFKPHVVGSVRQRTTPETLQKMGQNLEQLHARGKWTDLGFRGLWENMRGAFGDIALYENMLLDPEWIRDYCRTYTDLYKDELVIAFEEAGKPDGVWFFDDLGYRGATFCSPQLFGELIFPFYDELVDLIHSHGIPVILHTCGYTEPLLERIVGAGFDGLHPMEVKAGNDPLRIADRYAEQLVFIGGLDVRILESRDRDHIKKEVAGYLKGMKHRGARLVFGSDHSLSTNIDYEDFLFALEVYREHQAY